MASGIPLDALGEAIDLHSLVRLENPAIAFNHGKITGSIQYIDHFGNLITNVAGDLVKGKTWHIVYDRLIIYRGNTYSDVAHGSAVTLIGSHGWVEIAINGGNAHKELKINWADSIQIVFD